MWLGGMHGKGACVVGRHVWQGGMHGRGCAWQGVCMAGGVCGGVHGRGCVWQERWPLQWTVRILLECILVEYNQFPNLIFENISAVSVPSHTKLKKINNYCHRKES